MGHFVVGAQYCYLGVSHCETSRSSSSLVVGGDDDGDGDFNVLLHDTVGLMSLPKPVVYACKDAVMMIYIYDACRLIKGLWLRLAQDVEQ